MEFEWDKKKNFTNIEKHGINFEFASKIFEDANRIEIPDTRFDYGEDRIKVIGKVFNLFLSVIYTMRGTIRRIVSARAANRNERKLYNHSKK